MTPSVYERLKERIVQLELAPGAPLNAGALAKELGVSTTPIREALVRLEADGFVRRLPNTTPHVTEVHLADLKDVLEVRLLLSEQIGRLAAQRVTPSEIREMQRLLKKMESESDHRRLVHLDTEFHNVVNRATKNNALTKVAELIRNQMTRLWFYVHNERDYWKELVENRRQLVAALESSDGDAVARLLRAHVLSFIDQVREGSWG